MFGLKPLLVVGVLGLAASGYALLERTWRHAAEGRAERAEAQVIEQGRAIAQLTEEARAARQRAARFERIRQDVSAAANSRACADSPAVRAALRGLYQPSASSGASRPDGASAPSGSAR